MCGSGLRRSLYLRSVTAVVLVVSTIDVGVDVLICVDIHHIRHRVGSVDVDGSSAVLVNYLLEAAVDARRSAVVPHPDLRAPILRRQLVCQQIVV